MSIDFILPARASIMAALKADPGVTGFIPKAQIYPHTVPASPAWPFSRFASMIASPFLATGLDASAFRITLQAFSKDLREVPSDPASRLLVPAEDRVIGIGSAIKAALDGRTLPLLDPYKLKLTWVQTTPMIDGDETGAWMTNVIFNADISA